MTDYSSLSDEELLNEYKLLSKEVAKYNNFQMAKKSVSERATRRACCYAQA
jgi:hypothetical protein